MTEATTMERINVRLTGRRPVSIDPEEWPVIAHAGYHHYDGKYASQANRSWRGNLSVRQHSDGRVLVYATQSHESAWQNERGGRAHAGELLASATPGQLATTIERVHAGIDGGGRWAPLAAECIASIAAEPL